MRIRGALAGAVAVQGDWNQTDPARADYIRGKETVEEAINRNTRQIAALAGNLFTVGDTAPDQGPALWFNTAPGGAVNRAAMLLLDENETGYTVQTVVGDEIYGVDNATVNGGTAAGNYDFTVL